MARITIEAPAGIAPKIAPVKLGDALATVADNCRLDRGRLEGWKGLVATGDTVPAGSTSIYPYNGGFLGWLADVDVVGDITANDVRDRIAYTGDGYPKIRSGNEEYRLGIPIPSAPVVSVTAYGDKTSLTYVRNQSYRISFVDAWGAEGALSEPSASHEVGLGAELEVTLPAVPTGEYNFGVGARKRIYRSNSGSQSSIWQYVDEVVITADTYTDTKEPGDLQEQAITENWIAPPDDDTALYPEGPLQGLTILASGILVGFTGNVVCFSYPYVPHAWPADYRVTIPDGQVIGIASLAVGLLVCTDKKPYIIQGSSPEALIAIPVESERHQSCVSKRSIVDMGDFVIYASPDGLAIAQGNSVQLATHEFFSKHEWEAFEPTTIRAWSYEGKYIARYGSGGKGFIYDPQGDVKTFTTLDLDVEAGYLEIEDDALYLADADGNIHQFDAGDPLPYFWQSKIFVVANPTGFSCLRVEAESYPVQVVVKADGKTLLDKEVKNGITIRIPSGGLYRQWQVSMRGVNPVEYLSMADSMVEIV
ncbi:hypothetical protein [Endozoicomonas ascidiicola]|uniref:hypothetical protein n=1 Tax=Endozoicomonas ascidiicola TaxID=1698521 RepID=UPI000833F583|nr:hypothetical protein [Endozoicomonas ascidiicola]